MATIKPIEGRSVHQIQSGQVIVDLQSVCKELVENSIDAGATTIEVRFKNSGLDAIEIQDNGGGIAPDDYDTIALKHYTSKLFTYDDLSSLQTFGFRGEALSSLCALSKFHIVTARASDGPKGTKLEFEQSGKLKGTSVVAAKQGTTVVVESLFHNLPVRRKELEKTIKREYSKVLGLLNSYACISTGVKFSVSNQMTKGKKTVAFATNSNASTKENIANVYGTKTLLALIPLDLSFEMDPSNRPAATKSARNWSTQEYDGSGTVKIAGHISRPVVGEGRQTPDRQMFFVNSRPCSLPQVAKAFNEVYKSYNITQSAFIFANIKLDTNAYDVNVSPDKRTILLHDQTALLESLKDALIELFEQHEQSVPQAQLLGKKLPVQATFNPPTVQQQESTESAFEKHSEPRQISDDNLQPSSPVSLPESEEKPPRRDFVKASLINRLEGGDAEERVIHEPPQRIRASSSDNDELIQKAPHANPREMNALPENTTPQQLGRTSGSPLFEPEKDGSSLPQSLNTIPRMAQDFNGRLASVHTKQIEREQSSSSPDCTTNQEEEDPIPAIQQAPQSRSTQSTVQNAFDRMRPMRTPTQEATITVGDTTTISTIGSGSQMRASKRSRIHTPKSSSNSTSQDQRNKSSRLLTRVRRFAAPGTQMRDDDQGENSGQDEDEEMPDRTARTLSPAGSSRAWGEPKTERVNESLGLAPLGPRSPTDDNNSDSPDGETNEPPAEPAPQENDDDSDGEYIDEAEKKAREEAKIAKMIAEAEEAAARPTDMNLKRANKLFKISQKKYTTIHLKRVVQTNVADISRHIQALDHALKASESKVSKGDLLTATQLNKEDPEERLSLTVTKSDFNNMRIIGQFNLGFILAVRPSASTSSNPDLFIIDQHASDEKYNFERFSATTILVSQRLVHPHPLELTAVEEEVILSNPHALTANGFVVETDTTGNQQVGRRAKLTSLPMSKEATFTPTDLEELLALLLDNPLPPPPGDDEDDQNPQQQQQQYIPRPSKVRKLLASRACRSSVMIGKTLKEKKMRDIVRHMGGMDKPWSCPHGRPTMRHLFGLEKWTGWTEGNGVWGVGNKDDGEGGGGGSTIGGRKTDWAGWLESRRCGDGG